jgi:HEAT repeat protein
MLASVRFLRGRPSRVERLRRKGDAERLARLLLREKLVRDGDGRIVDRATGERTAAVEALIDIGGPAAYGGLVRAMRDPEPIVRSAAIRGLRERGYSEAAAPLVEAVTNWTSEPAAAIRGEALDALVSFARTELPSAVVVRLLEREAELDEGDRRVLQALVGAGGPDAARPTVSHLAGQLRDGAVSSRARTLLSYLAPESVDPLIDLLGEPSTQREAAWALGAIHDSRATEPLCHVLLSSEDAGVRVAASWALGEIRDPAAVAALLRASNDSDFDVRAETIAAFDKLGNVAVAIAMSVQVRAALEEGAERAAAMLDGGHEGTAAELGEGEAPEVQPERPDPGATPPRRSQPPPPFTPRTPLAERARPILRRWLGEERP